MKFVSISIANNNEARKVAYVKVGQNDIVAGTFSLTGEKDVHVTYHDNGHCHYKKKENGKLVREDDLFDGKPILKFKGKVNLFNRLFQSDFSTLPETVSIPSRGLEDIKFKFMSRKPHLMSIFLIENGRKDLLPVLNKDEFALYDKCSPWALVTFFEPTNDKWNNIMKGLEQGQHICFDIYQSGIASYDKPSTIDIWIPPEFDKNRDLFTLSFKTEKI